MSIRIITKRKLRFYTPDRKESIVTQGNNVIEEMPDWVERDLMYRTAKASGILSVLASAPLQKLAENDPHKVVPQTAHDEAPLLIAKEDAPLPEIIEEPTGDEAKAAKAAARKAARKAKKDK